MDPGLPPTPELEARLRRPERGERGFREGVEAYGRIDALRMLSRRAAGDETLRRGRPGGVNAHVHTAKSYGVFASPAEAAWAAWCERVEVLGISDHHTLAGVPEFREACGVLGIRPVLGLEVLATWEEARAAGATVNDPSNPGRTYVTAKGVTRALRPGAAGARTFERAGAALLARHREMARRLAARVTDRLGPQAAFRFEEVLELTPHGQPTERHVVEALALRLEAVFPDPEARRRAVEELTESDVEADTLEDDVRFQSLLRARLVKAGRPAWVEESRAALPPVARAIELALELGAVPAYPVLGDPVTAWEEDVPRLLERVERAGFAAVEVIPDRNSRGRLRAVVDEAAKRSFPVLNGTEHNTRARGPLVDRWFFDPEFRPHFECGARVVLGHQRLRERAEEGWVREDGTLPAKGREARRERLEAAGAEVWPGRCRGTG